MAANYLTEAYVDARMGADVRARIFSDEEDGGGYNVDKFTAAVVDASELVRGFARTAARDGSGELGETTTDTNVMMASYGAFFAAACMRPENQLPLPVDWDVASPYALALRAVRDGKLQFSRAIDPVIANTVTSPLTTDFPQRTSRTELAGL